MSVVISSSYVIGDSVSGGGIINADNPLIGWHNLAMPGKIIARSEAPGFPASNLGNNSTNLRWQGTLVGFSEYVTVNIDDPEPIDYLAIARHNLFSAQRPVSVEGHEVADAFTKAFLRFDGPDGSTAFADDAPSPKAFVAAGNAQIDTSQFRLGGASLRLDGTGDFLTNVDSPDFALGAADWTVEAYFRVNAAGGAELRLCGQTDPALTAADSSFYIQRTAANVMQLQVSAGASFAGVTGTTPFTNALNAGWHHLAAVRAGNVLKLFIDGVQEGGDVAFTASVPDSTAGLAIGARGAAAASNPWNGWIDHFRFSIGIARWTTNFTPPEALVLVPDVMLPNDGPALFRFPPRALAAISLRMHPGAAAPTIAVLYTGRLLVLQRRIYVGHTPMPFGRTTRITNARSEAGHFLGRIVLSQKTGTEVTLQNLTPDWYRTKMEPFLAQAQENPFFFAWRPGGHPNEVGYAWLTNDPQPKNQLPNGMMQVSLEMEGVV